MQPARVFLKQETRSGKDLSVGDPMHRSNFDESLQRLLQFVHDLTGEAFPSKESEIVTFYKWNALAGASRIFFPRAFAWVCFELVYLSIPADSNFDNPH